MRCRACYRTEAECFHSPCEFVRRYEAGEIEPEEREAALKRYEWSGITASLPDLSPGAPDRDCASPQQPEKESRDCTR